MRIDGDRGWRALVALLGVLALVATACSNQIGGGRAKAPAIAAGWVKLPSVLLGGTSSEIFPPEAIAQSLGKAPNAGGEGPLPERPKTTEAGVETIKVRGEGGSAFLAAKPPY